MPVAFQGAVEDSFGQMRIGEDPTPGGQGLVGYDSGGISQRVYVALE